MPYEAMSFPIGGPQVYKGLIQLYSILAIWSAGVVYFGAQTVGEATNPTYGKIFPLVLFFCSLTAIWGMIRSRYTRKIWVEYIGTVLLLAGLAGYSIAIAIVAIRSGEYWRLPGVLLPVMVGRFPVLRLHNIVKVVRERAEAKRAYLAALRDADEK